MKEITIKHELELCPFCGGQPVTNQVDDTYFVECTCGAAMLSDSEDSVISAWNSRVAGQGGKKGYVVLVPTVSKDFTPVTISDRETAIYFAKKIGGYLVE